MIRQLRDRRIAAGLSLADIAERTGIDKAALSRLENLPDANPTLETLLRYGDAIGAAIEVS